MKKFILMLAVICAITFAGQAQDTKTQPAKTTTTQTKTTPAGQQQKPAATETPEQKAQAAVDKLDKTVTLTDDQKTKIKALALTKFTDVDAIRAKYKGQADKKEVEKQEIQAAQKTYRDGVNKILTPDQIKKMEDAEKAAKVNTTKPQQKTTTPPPKK